jgi:Tfp pilus assembly protein PilX
MPDWWEHGGNMDATLHHVSDREHWIVNSDQSLINTKIYWVANNHTDGAFCVHGFDDGIAIEFIASDLAVTYWSSTLWRNAVGTVSGDHNNGSITSSYIPFGYKASTVITFGSKHNLNPLPVELIAYKSECKGESAELYWATASEVNNDYFVLQRSTDAQNFTEIARIIGHGNSNVINYYSYQDTEQKSGTVYYRLLQFDYDGASEILGVVQSNCSDNIESVASVDVSPNPFRNDLNISLNNFNTDSKVVYEIVDMYGRVLVSEEIIGTSHKTIYLQNLKPGLYMLRVIDGDKVFVNKIIKN